MKCASSAGNGEDPRNTFRPDGWMNGRAVGVRRRTRSGEKGTSKITLQGVPYM